MNVRVVNVDSASLRLEWTDDEVDLVDVFPTFGAARLEVIERCIPERDAWSRMIAQARVWTKEDVQ